MDGLYVHLGSESSAAPKYVRGSFQKLLSPIRDLFACTSYCCANSVSVFSSLNKCLLFQLKPKS